MSVIALTRLNNKFYNNNYNEYNFKKLSTFIELSYKLRTSDVSPLIHIINLNAKYWFYFMRE